MVLCALAGRQPFGGFAGRPEQVLDVLVMQKDVSI